jgi:hypothetical protein
MKKIQIERKEEQKNERERKSFCSYSEDIVQWINYVLFTSSNWDFFHVKSMNHIVVLYCKNAKKVASHPHWSRDFFYQFIRKHSKRGYFWMSGYESTTVCLFVSSLLFQNDSLRVNTIKIHLLSFSIAFVFWLIKISSDFA